MSWISKMQIKKHKEFQKSRLNHKVKETVSYDHCVCMCIVERLQISIHSLLFLQLRFFKSTEQQAAGLAARSTSTGDALAPDFLQETAIKVHVFDAGREEPNMENWRMRKLTTKLRSDTDAAKKRGYFVAKALP